MYTQPNNIGVIKTPECGTHNKTCNTHVIPNVPSINTFKILGARQNKDINKQTYAFTALY